MFMTGGRTCDGEIVSPRSELALRHGGGTTAETTAPAEAYAGLPSWQPGHPEDVGGLPWF